MTENVIQPKEGRDVKWNAIRKIGVAATDAAKRLFLRSQDVLSEEKMGRKAVEEPEKRKVSPFAKLVLGVALAAGCTDNVTNNYYYGQDGGQNEDTAGDVDTDSDTGVDADSDTDTDSDGDTATLTESDTGTGTQTDTGSETGTATVTDTADAGCVEEVLDVNGGGFVTSLSVFDQNVGAQYTLSVITDSPGTGSAYVDIPANGYPAGPFTMEHRFFGEGVPEYTNSAQGPVDRSDRHNIAMLFNNELWELAQFDGAMQTVKLGEQAVAGIINIGETTTLPNGYKLRLEDISSVVNENGERDAIMTLLDASDNVVGAMALTPGRIMNVMGGEPPVLVKVNQVHEGINFISKWAQVFVYSDVLTLQDGAELPGGEKVALALSMNSAEVITLKAIRVYRPVNECKDTDTNGANPLAVKPFTNKQWTITYNGDGSTCIFAAYDGAEYHSTTTEFKLKATPFDFGAEMALVGSVFYQVGPGSPSEPGHGANWGSTTCGVSTEATAYIVFVNSSDNKKYLLQY